MIELKWARQYKFMQEGEVIPLHARTKVNDPNSKGDDAAVLDTNEYPYELPSGAVIQERRDHYVPAYKPMNWREISDHYLSRGNKEQHI